MPDKFIEKMNTEVDDIMAIAVETGDPTPALDFAASLAATGYLRGIQLARLLYEIDEAWDKFDTDDTAEDAVFKHMGTSPVTFHQYTRMYRYVLKDRPRLVGKPIRGLIGLIAAARDEEFDDDDWEEIYNAMDVASMLAVRYRVRGLQTSGHARIVIEHSRDGYVRARRGEETEELGFLTRSPKTDVGRRALDRIQRGSGMVER
jgi:hypothetical protein